MPIISNLKIAALVIGIVVAGVVQSDARPQIRKHKATEAEGLSLIEADRTIEGSKIAVRDDGISLSIQSNGLPTHTVGKFPNRDNPYTISAQSYAFSVPKAPTLNKPEPLLRDEAFGVALNGVPFDPEAAEFWQGDPRSGWVYNALGGAVSLGLDANFAHVQPSGAYHYLGLPIGLMEQLGWQPDAASPLIGFASDGFPIYALTADVGGTVIRMTSSYQLKSGERPGGDEPSGPYDGAFQQDFEFVAGSGTLDECNGVMIKTADYPTGTYAYFLTDDYPVIPRCLRGASGSGFSKY